MPTARSAPRDARPPLVFVSYSHKDKAHVGRLRVHLAPLERGGLVDYWDDARILAGARWRAAIARAIGEARVAVLIISADFYASDFIAKDELPPLLRRHARRRLDVLGVIVSPSRFERDPFLSKLKTINSPTRPLEKLRRPDREKVWDEVARAVEANVTLESAGKGVALIDRLEPQLMSVMGEPAGRAATHRVMVKSVGKAIVGTVKGKPHRTVTAAELRKLPREHLLHLRTHERSMERHYARWQGLYPRRADPKVERQLRSTVKAMRTDLLGILSFLQRLGLNLEDHYSRIRDVVERG